MRKILMSEKGEFKSQRKADDYVRSTAVKMMSSVIRRSDNNKKEVIISNKASQDQPV